MEIIEGNALAELCDYSFGDHHAVWDSNLTGTYAPANISNFLFLQKCKEFERKIMTVFIDNIRLYRRPLFTKSIADANLIDYLMAYNDLLELCKLFPNNKFVIFCSHEDTPIDNTIKVPENVLGIHAVNAVFNNNKIHPFPIGLQRQIGNDHRLQIMEQQVLEDYKFEPKKLLYINCGIERNPEREPLRKFETNDWCTTRFDKDSKFFPYEAYHAFLRELRDHKFVVCPKGHGYDTHRIWETLYMRRVPLMLNDPYFRLLLKDFPILFVENWEFLKDAGKLLDLRDDLYEQAQTMDLSKLDLKLIFERIMNGYTQKA